MIKENINLQTEDEKLKHCKIFSNSGFMVTVKKKDGTVDFKTSSIGTHTEVYIENGLNITI